MVDFRDKTRPNGGKFWSENVDALGARAKTLRGHNRGFGLCPLGRTGENIVSIPVSYNLKRSFTE